MVAMEELQQSKQLIDANSPLNAFHPKFQLQHQQEQHLQHQQQQHPQTTTAVIDIYKITVLLNRDGAVKLMTVCFVITVMVAILIKLFKATTRSHGRKYLVKWTGVFACINTLWVCACVMLLTKCLWMIINDNNDPDHVIRLFPWYIAIIISCCVIDIAESCALRPSKKLKEKTISVGDEFVQRKELKMLAAGTDLRFVHG